MKPLSALKAVRFAVGIGLFLVSVKAFAFFVSGAASVLATLVDSLADVAVSFFTLLAIHYSLKPADFEHRYGHGKIEGLVALGQSMVIFGGGVMLAIESVRRISVPQSVEQPLMAAGIVGISILFSVLLVFIQERSLKDAPSLAVEADQSHYTTDIFLNFGVIVTLALQYWGGPSWIDPVFAIFVVFYLGMTAMRIAKKGINMLLDRELSEEDRDQIKALIKAEDRIGGYHDLRTRATGQRIEISFDVEINPEMTLRRAHDIVKDLENSILKHYPNADILIHKDPLGDTDDSRHHVAIHHEKH